MSVNSVSSNSASQAPKVQQKAESSEVQKAKSEVKKTADSDNGSSTAAKAPQPTVNHQGQTIGTTISVKA